MTDVFYPPVSFYFAVSIDADIAPARIDGAFQEVSGIATNTETEPFAESGKNRFVHALPRGVKNSNLVLKRGIIPLASPLVDWAKQTLESGLETSIQPRGIMVRLLDEKGAAMRGWQFMNAWPVRWDVAPLDVTNDSLMIEKLELDV